MKDFGLNKPIFIIGGVRSGTTMMGDILSKHEDLAYWIEPKYIWKYRNPTAPDDFRVADEATPAVKAYIRKRFSNFVKAHNKSRFIEKTPSNVFRIPFIDQVFPDAIFIQLIRNGNDTVLSTERKWLQTPAGSAIKRRLTSNEIPLRDLPYYTFAIASEVLVKFIKPNKVIWGQRFKNIKTFRKEHSILETCAKQWSEGVRIPRRDLAKIASDRVIRIRYEDVIMQPEQEIAKLLAFLNLKESDAVLAYAKQNVINKATKYTKEEQEKIAQIQPIIAEQMRINDYV